MNFVFNIEMLRNLNNPYMRKKGFVIHNRNHLGTRTPLSTTYQCDISYNITKVR